MSSDIEEELSFLNDLEAGKSAAVRAIIDSPDLPDQEKLSALSVLLDQQHLDRYKEFRQKRTPKGKLLKLLKKDLREVCEKLIDASNASALRTILKGSAPEVEQALAEFENSIREMSPSEKFLTLLKPDIRTNCRKLLETGNFRAVRTIIPISEQYVHSALDDLETTYNQDAPSMISEETTSRRSFCDRSVSECTLVGQFVETIVLDPITERHIRHFQSKLRSIEDLYQVHIQVKRCDQDFKAEISGDDRDSLSQSLIHFMKICERQDFKYESDVQKQSKAKLPEKEIMEIFKLFSCICSDKDQTIVFKANGRKQIDQAKDYILNLRIDSLSNVEMARNNPEKKENGVTSKQNVDCMTASTKEESKQPSANLRDRSKTTFVGNSLTSYLQSHTLQEAAHDFANLLKAKLQEDYVITRKVVETKPVIKESSPAKPKPSVEPSNNKGDHDVVHGRSKADIPFSVTPNDSPAVPPRRAGCNFAEDKDTVDMANERSTRSYVTTTPVTHSTFSSLDFEKGEEFPHFRYLSYKNQQLVHSLLTSNELGDKEMEENLKQILIPSDFELYEAWKAKKLSFSSDHQTSSEGWTAIESVPKPNGQGRSSLTFRRSLISSTDGNGIPIQRQGSFRCIKGNPSSLNSTKNRSNSAERQSLRSDPHNSHTSSASGIEEYDPLNIVLLGETGSGKSTLVNSIVNYSVYKNFDDALKYGVKVVIPTKFSCLDNGYKSTTIECKVNVAHATDDNEELETGMSSTQKCRSYYIKFGEKSDFRPIRIIDTPGIGDSRGPEQDDKNMDEILSYIERFEELHAICIVLSPIVRHCLEKLLLHLHKSAAQNIMFCFTHATQTHFQVGESFPLLKKYFEDLNSKENRVVLTKSNCFMFDNECYRYLCAKNRYVDLGDSSGSKDSWIRSRNELKRFLVNVEKLKSHVVAATISLYSTKKVVYALCAPIVDILLFMIMELTEMQETLRQVKDKENEETTFRFFLDEKENLIEIIKLDNPQTVCTSSRCTGRITADNGTKIVKHLTCHNICHCLKGITPERSKNPQLKKCTIMNKDGKCKACDCSWEHHMHQNFGISCTEKPMLSNEKKKTINALTSNREKYKAIEASLSDKLSKWYSDYDYIVNSCAIFSVFLDKNSIAGSMDYFYYNLKNMLEQEEAGENGQPATTTRIENLQDILKDYEKCRDKLQYSKEINVTTVRNTINTLKSLATVGRQIEEILTIQSQVYSHSEATDLQDWFNDIRKHCRITSNVLNEDMLRLDHVLNLVMNFIPDVTALLRHYDCPSCVFSAVVHKASSYCGTKSAYLTSRDQGLIVILVEKNGKDSFFYRGVNVLTILVFCFLDPRPLVGFVSGFKLFSITPLQYKSSSQ